MTSPCSQRAVLPQAKVLRSQGSSDSAISALLLVVTLLFSEFAHAEPRLRAGEEDLIWSQSVLRLKSRVTRQIENRQRHYIENCTATVVRGGARPLLVTAWHCVKGQTDLTRPPRVELDGQWIDTRVLATGGSMLDDWAVLEVQATRDSQLTAMRIGSNRLAIGERILAGGFSRDSGLGSGGEFLTFHRDCQIQYEERAGAGSNCLAYRGASGGPVITFNDNGQPLLVGVISAGDSQSRSILVPLTRFQSRLAALL